jgi:hypoxanthine phosphoribosyltransferase
MFRDKATPYITAPEIQNLCRTLGKRIEKDYKGKDLVMICILKGSILFFADLIRHIDLPMKVDFMRLSSYGHSTESSGTVRIIKDISQDIRGKDVLIVEDILDTGHTLSFLQERLRSSGTASVKLCTLLEKPARRKVQVTADYVGRSIEDHFVVGYGLDFQEKCRNYPDILFVSE